MHSSVSLIPATGSRISGSVMLLLLLCISSCSFEEWSAPPRKPAESVSVLTTTSPDKSGTPNVERNKYDAGLIERTKKAAVWDFNNRKMYRDPTAWTGKIVAIVGEYPGTGAHATMFVENDNQFMLSGYNNSNVSVLVNLDHPLPRREAFGKSYPLIGPEQKLNVFGRIGKMKNLMDDDGNVRAIIQMDCILIFDVEDYSFQKPYWVTAKYEQLPDGTVTTDSLIYEFDKSK
jgi:hypothetical protein